MPASPAQIAANRANARRSTGPRTPKGRARSAQNSLQHGAYAADETILATPTTPALDYLRALTAHFAPAGPLESLLVRRLAALAARLDLLGDALDALLILNDRRALTDYLHDRYNLDRPAARLPDQPSWGAALRRFDAGDAVGHAHPAPAADPGIAQVTLAYTLSAQRSATLLRHETAADRRFHATLHELLRRQADRRAQGPASDACPPRPAQKMRERTQLAVEHPSPSDAPPRLTVGEGPRTIGA